MTARRRPIPRASRPGLRVRLRGLRDWPFPFNSTNQFDGPRQLFQVQSACLLLAGGAMLAAARMTSARRRRNIAAATLLIVGALVLGIVGQRGPGSVVGGRAQVAPTQQR